MKKLDFHFSQYVKKRYSFQSVKCKKMEQILFGAKRAEKGSASYTARKEPRMVQHPTLLEKFTDVAVALLHVTKLLTISFFLRKLSVK